MKYCSKCGNQILEEAIICPSCGCMVEDKAINDDYVSIGLCMLSFLVPIFGIIYWACTRKKTPHKARACCAAMFIRIIAPLVFILDCLILGIFLGFNEAFKTTTTMMLLIH